MKKFISWFSKSFLNSELSSIFPLYLLHLVFTCCNSNSVFFSNNAISFNAVKESFGKYLLNYKKEINLVGYLSENFWNNKKTLQLVVRDLII